MGGAFEVRTEPEIRSGLSCSDFLITNGFHPLLVSRKNAFTVFQFVAIKYDKRQSTHGSAVLICSDRNKTNYFGRIEINSTSLFL